MSLSHSITLSVTLAIPIAPTIDRYQHMPCCQSLHEGRHRHHRGSPAFRASPERAVYVARYRQRADCPAVPHGSSVQSTGHLPRVSARMCDPQACTRETCVTSTKATIPRVSDNVSISVHLYIISSRMHKQTHFFFFFVYADTQISHTSRRRMCVSVRIPWMSVIGAVAAYTVDRAPCSGVRRNDK